MLNETSQTEKDKYCIISQVESKTAKLIKTKSRMVFTRDCGMKELERSSFRVKIYN